MIKIVSVRIVLQALALFLPAHFCLAFPAFTADTLSNSDSSFVQYPDTLDIGPDFEVTGEACLVDEDLLPSLGEVLDQFVFPFRGNVISQYGIRRGRMHTGTDIKLHLGDTVVAAYQGVVTRAQTYYGYGRMVIINHSHGLETYYAHLSSILVKSGDTVQTGQPLGLGGRTGRATGTHLHFEIRENGKAYNPELVYDFGNFTLRPGIQEKAMLAELIRKPRVSERGHIIEMGDTPPEYVVRAGDTLWAIARRFQVTVKELCDLNNLTSQSVLRIGTVLRIY